VCDPRKNALLKEGSKSDKIDARKLAELLRLNNLKPVYHGEHGVRTLKELARSNLTITQDLTRLGIGSRRCIEVGPFPVPARESTHDATARNSSARSAKPVSGGAPNTTTSNSMPCGPCARKCGGESKAWKLPRQIPGIGAIRAALLIALMQSPHRFRTKRQLWTYNGLGLETHDSAQYCVVDTCLPA
jgi:transposase